MCAGMIELKKALNRNLELEEELKSTRDGYEEEMLILVEKNDDLTRKLGVFMGDPSPGGEEDEEEPKEIPPEDYIIIDDTDSEPDDSKDQDYEDDAGADIRESSADQYF